MRAEMDDRGTYGMNNLTPKMKIDKCCSDGWETLDICEKCADSFEAWWKGVRRNSEHMG